MKNKKHLRLSMGCFLFLWIMQTALRAMLEQMTIEVKLPGEMPSKKNRWRMGENGMYIPKDVSKELEAFVWDLKSVRNAYRLAKPHEGEVLVSVTFFVKKDKDLDNMTTTLLDLLQAAGLIKNDMQVVGIEAAKRYVKAGEKPCIEFDLTLLP